MREDLIKGHLFFDVHETAPPLPNARSGSHSSARQILTRGMSGFQQSLLLIDSLILILSFVISYTARDAMIGEWNGWLRRFSMSLWVLWVILPTWLSALWFFGFYHSNRYWSYRELLVRLAKTQVVAALGVMSIFYLSKNADVSRLFIQTFIGVSFLLLVGANLVVRELHERLRRKGLSLHNVVIAGLSHKALDYYEATRGHPYWGVSVLGFLRPEDEAPRQEFCGKPILGSLTSLGRVLREHVVDEVILALPHSQSQELEKYINLCEEMGVTARVVLDIPRTLRVAPTIEMRGPLPLLSFESTFHGNVALGVKRALDICGALFGLTLFGVVYLCCAPKIRKESPGPVIFKQTRVGKHGRLFTLYKFRTMHQDAEARRQALIAHNEMSGPIFKIKNDPRITPFGHALRETHLDELPQFWNVLRGEMSLVGTRPPTPDEVAQYLPSHYRRLSMRPGLTGFWQLNGNAISDFDEVVRLDCQYIDQWSLWLDLKILARTLQKVMGRRGW